MFNKAAASARYGVRSSSSTARTGRSSSTRGSGTAAAAKKPKASLADISNPLFDKDGGGRGAWQESKLAAQNTPEAVMLLDMIAANKQRVAAGLPPLPLPMRNRDGDGYGGGGGDEVGVDASIAVGSPPPRRRRQQQQRGKRQGSGGGVSGALRRLSAIASDRVKHVREKARSDGEGGGAHMGALLQNHALDGASRWQELALLAAYFLTGFGVYHHLEGWDLLDSVYFTVVSVTTVGYGDLYPTTQVGMVFSIFYLAVGLVLVGAMISQFGQAVLARAEEVLLRKLDDDPNDDEAPDDRWQLAMAGASVLGVLLCGTLFFALSEEDHWEHPARTALYFSLVTMSTVGYGDVTVSQRHSKGFAIFYILLSSVVFATALDKVSMVYAARAAEAKKQRFLAMELDVAGILDMDDSGDGKVDKGEFLYFGLQKMGSLEAGDADVARIMEAFDTYDVDGSGSLDHYDITMLLEGEEERRRARVAEAAEQAAAKETARSERKSHRLTSRLRAWSSRGDGDEHSHRTEI
jgi:voltage-gated potassium channel Kch